MELDDKVAELQILLVLKKASLSLVTEEKYKPFLFILGLPLYELGGTKKSYQSVLTLFNKFHTSTIKNFIEMIEKL